VGGRLDPAGYGVSSWQVRKMALRPEGTPAAKSSQSLCRFVGEAAGAQQGTGCRLTNAGENGA
jgi:hypothetical protein